MKQVDSHGGKAVKNTSYLAKSATLLPGILAGLSALLAVAPAAHAQANLVRNPDQTMEIRGGSGREAWRIPFGAQTGWREVPSQFCLTPGDRAWFSYGGWLRLVDTRKGEVIGRWHFPGQITGLAAHEEKVQVTDELQEGPRSHAETVLFDPHGSRPQFYLADLFVSIRAALLEAGFIGGAAGNPPLSEAARSALPALEDAARRDPTAWRRARLAWIMRAAGDPRAQQMLAEAVRTSGADYSELLPLSNRLEAAGETDLAREAFDRGYRDFWEHGNDPRMVTTLFTALGLPGGQWDWDRLTPQHRQELIERFYRFAPYRADSEYAWKLNADALEKSGPQDLARLWRQRAEDARGRSGWNMQPGLLVPTDEAILIVMASVLAALFFLLALLNRYRSQRQLDAAARKRSPAAAGAPGGVRLFGLEYWSRADRVGFLLIVLAGWLAMGFALAQVSGILRLSAAPVGATEGSYAGPLTKAYFESFPATPERDLLLAVAAQQSGDLSAAEKLYRGAPQFAESWNNLGVILQQTGKKEEAQKAFARALEIEPGLAEASYNLGRATPSLWTELHEKYLPGQPMLAPPHAERLARASLGGSLWSQMPLIAAWPFRDKMQLGLDELLGLGTGLRAGKGLIIGAILLLAACLAFVFFVPVREVTQAPSRWHAVWQILFPGTAPLWSVLGGLVLTLWCYLLLQNVFIEFNHTARIITTISLPNLKAAFGISADQQALLKLVNPGWDWLVAAPAALFLLNLFLVWRNRPRPA